MKTIDQARAELLRDLDQQGISIAEWARRNSVPRQSVYDVFRGRSKGRLGHSHAVVVALGVKKGAPAADESSTTLTLAA